MSSGCLSISLKLPSPTPHFIPVKNTLAHNTYKAPKYEQREVPVLKVCAVYTDTINHWKALGAYNKFNNGNTKKMLWGKSREILNIKLLKIKYKLNSWFLNKRKVLSYSVQFSSVTQSCPALCDPVDCSTPGLPVLHHPPELAHTHVC